MAEFRTSLKAQFPVVLLPVQVQVKYVEHDAAFLEKHPERARRELLVRIYPDRISVTTHEPDLTDSEALAGQTYWRQALGRPDLAERFSTVHDLGAWRVLVAKYGASRSAWVVQQTAPTNLGSIIFSLSNGAPAPEPTFRDFPPNDAAWNAPARAVCLPSRFVVTLFRQIPDVTLVADPYVQEHFLQRPLKDHFVYPDSIRDTTTEFLYTEPWMEVAGRDIKEGSIAVGIDPTSDSDLTDDAGLGGALAWMADFEQALEQGMAVAVPLDKLDDKELSTGFKRLVVLGVRDQGEGPEEQQHLLAELLRGHLYTEGLALVPQGTPTNNTSGQDSGFNSADQYNAEASFATFLAPARQPAVDPENQLGQADAPRLFDGLGMEFGEVAQVDPATATDVKEAQLMNRALWPATYGYFLEEMLRPVLGSAADSLKVIDWTRRFFEDNVIARGGLPAIRVGNEPYGMLLATPYSQWQVPTSLGTWGGTLWDLIRRLDATWTERLNQVADYQELSTEVPFRPEPPSQQNFLTVLGQDASSVEFYQRYMLGPSVLDTLAHRTNIWPVVDTAYHDDPNTPENPRQRNALPGRFDKPTPQVNPIYESFRLFFDPSGTLGLPQYEWPKIFNHAFESGYRKVVHTFADEPRPRAVYDDAPGAMIDGLPFSETNPIKPMGVADQPEERQVNYIEWLTQVDFDQIRTENFGVFYGGEVPGDFTVPDSLLYRLLRQAILLQYWDAGTRTLAEKGMMPYEAREEVEFFNITRQDTARWDWLYNQDFGMPLHAFLREGRNFYGDQLNQYIAQIAALGKLPTARLERLLAEHLDLGNHRIDAWKLGQVLYRLTELRQDYRIGSYVGAFGWLEDVKPQDRSGSFEQSVSTEKSAGDAASADEKALAFESTTSGKPRQDPDNLGYIHAPSINHGVAAAVLRQGYKSRQFETDPENPAANRMAVNLSSQRVRKALTILEGIRTGQSLGALLGQDFEQGLSQYTATTSDGKPYAFYLPRFRAKFPYSQEKTLLGQPALTGDSAPEQAARQTVDGLALLKGTQGAYPYGINASDLPAAASNPGFVAAVRRELDALANTVDALGDLTTGESIYQAVTGNVEQAAAILENVAKGRFPAAPEIVHPPRAGHKLTHRVLLHLPTATPALSNWGTTVTPRAAAEPALNRWLAGLLGNPALISIAYAYQVGSQPAVNDTLLLSAARLQPIDVLFMLDEQALQPGSAFALHLAHVIRQVHSVSEALVTVTFSNSVNSGLARLVPLTRRLRQLLGTCRPAVPQDFAAAGRLAPGETEAQLGSITFGEVAPRVQTLLTNLEQERQSLAAALAPASTTTTPQQLRALLHRIVLYGVPEAATATAPALVDDRATAQAVLGQLERRVSRATALLSEGGNSVQKFVEAAQALLGNDFHLSVQSQLTPSVENEYRSAVAASGTLITQLPNRHLSVLEWLQGIARVREPMDHLEKVMMLNDLLADASATNQVVRLAPAQLTSQGVRAADQWMGMAYTGDYVPANDTLSLVQILPEPYTVPTGGVQQALWLDEWMETIPQKEQTTSLVFHYDQPNTEAPQCVLLAVSPASEKEDPWTWSDLLGSVNEALDLAKKRAVEPDALAFTHLGMLLPGLTAPVSKEGVTLSNDFRRLNGTSQFVEELLLPSK
ncbi:hypothetical protein GCM10023185_36700 [Hymenobacter saemangeumensis]|uniref:Uncharacterized protein n=1 Tax=Hymenobacter saemangeumensis TaxID=1084522 RepID=A0ABP8IRJ8_9BACT